MKNNTIAWVIGIIVVLVIGYFVITMPTQKEEQKSVAQGSVVVSFTDATADIQNVNEVSMGVNKVELYSQSKGWVTVSSDHIQYQLLDLHAKSQAKVYAKTNVVADNYSRARVTLSDVKVKTKTNGEKMASIPSNIITITGTIKVKADTTSSIKFDVLADKSLYVTAKGDYIFAPVLKIESRSDATVSTSSDGTVVSSGGTVDTNINVGMDLDGSVKTDFQVDTNIKLDVNASGNIGIINATDGSIKIINIIDNSDTNTNVNTTSKVNTDVNGSVKGTVKGILRD